MRSSSLIVSRKGELHVITTKCSVTSKRRLKFAIVVFQKKRKRKSGKHELMYSKIPLCYYSNKIVLAL